MYTIEVKVDTIDYDRVIELYNSKKDKTEIKIERLPRHEGGFMIGLSDNDLNKLIENNHYIDENFKIRQLRWSNKCLIGYSSSNQFNINQLDLLYDSIKQCIGEDNVMKIDYISPSSFCNYQTIIL